MVQLKERKGQKKWASKVREVDLKTVFGKFKFYIILRVKGENVYSFLFSDLQSQTSPGSNHPGQKVIFKIKFFTKIFVACRLSKHLTTIIFLAIPF